MLNLHELSDSCQLDVQLSRAYTVWFVKSLSKYSLNVLQTVYNDFSALDAPGHLIHQIARGYTWNRNQVMTSAETVNMLEVTQTAHIMWSQYDWQWKNHKNTWDKIDNEPVEKLQI